MPGGEQPSASLEPPPTFTATATGPTDDAGETARRSAQRRQRLLAVAAVGLVAAFGTGLRGAQAAAYLPWEHHWDEITNVGVGEEMSANLSPDPGFYDYPALIFAAQALVLVPAAQFSGYDPDAGDVLDVQTDADARVDEPGLLLTMRWVAGVIPGAVTIVVAGMIAWTVTGRWWASAVGALLAALAAVDLRFGAFVTPDALSGMSATVAAWGAVRVAFEPARRHYLLTGAAIGLAAAAKYNAAVVALALVIAHLLTHRRPVAERRPLLEAAGVAAAVFAVVNIGAVLHPVRFVQEIGSEGVHYGSGHFGNEGSSPIFNAGWLWQSFGLGLVLAACALAGRSPRVQRAAFVLLGFVGAYYLFVSAFPVRFARNLLPVTGPTAAAAAIGLFVVVERLGGLRSPVARTAPALLAAGATLVVPVASARAAMASITEDPWAETRRWMAESVPEGATVAVEARAPFVDPARYDVVATTKLAEHDVDWYQEHDVDVLVAVDQTFQPHLDRPGEDPETAATYRELLADDCVAFEAEGGAFGTGHTAHRIVVLRLPPC